MSEQSARAPVVHLLADLHVAVASLEMRVRDGKRGDVTLIALADAICLADALQHATADRSVPEGIGAAIAVTLERLRDIGIDLAPRLVQPGVVDSVIRPFKNEATRS